MRYHHVVFCAGALCADRDRTTLFDGTERMLRALAADGVRIGTVARGHGPLDLLFEGTGLSPLAVAADDAGDDPFPDLLVRYLGRTGAHGRDVLLVGADGADADLAAAAGVDFALACWVDEPAYRHVRANAYLMAPWHTVEFVRREPSVADREPWLAWTRELEAIAQAGLYYGRDPYDLERFARIRELAADAMTRLSGLPLDRVEGLFCDEDGYQTPKLDTRAVIFDDDGRICLVNERQGGWAVPGGWLDQGQTVFSNAVKEAREEAGLDVVPLRIIALEEHNLHNEHPFAWGILKVFVLCEPVGGEFAENVETMERGFFHEDGLPEPLLASKTTREQIEMCFAAHEAGTAWELVVD